MKKSGFLAGWLDAYLGGRHLMFIRVFSPGILILVVSLYYLIFFGVYSWYVFASAFLLLFLAYLSYDKKEFSNPKTWWRVKVILIEQIIIILFFTIFYFSL